MSKPKIIILPSDTIDGKKKVLMHDGKLINVIEKLDDFTIIEENNEEITFIYDGIPVTYGIVDGQNGTKWLDRNLGANRVAEAIDDDQSYGDVYQWGRFKDGHEKRNSDSTMELSPSNTPSHGDFIINTDSNTHRDWRDPQNDNLWQRNNRINMPAPNGWRVPTYLEFLAERDSWSEPTSIDALNSNLKLPSSGGRENNGNFGGMGNSGAYWTSTIGGTSAGVLNFSVTGSNLMNSIFRAFALPIRLIKDQELEETIIYDGMLTPEYQDQEEDIIGYGNWPEDEIGVYGTIDPVDENILQLAYYNDNAFSGGAIFLIGYQVTKITIGEIEYTNFIHGEDGDGNIGTIFTNIEESPFILDTSIRIIF